MPPTSDGEIRIVGCSLEKLIPDAEHLKKIRAAIAATHKATILVSELLNIHLRKTLTSDPAADMSCFFDSNWLLNAYNEVTVGKRKVKVVPELRATRDRYMPPFEPPDRSGTTQCLLYECRNLAAVAATNVWMHFQKRVLRHVRSAFALTEEEYKDLAPDRRRRRKLELMQVAADVCKQPTSTPTAPESYQEWIRTERCRIGIDAAVGEWGDKPLLYHIKAKPHRFLRCMAQMSTEQEAVGGRAFALYPLRHSYVPRHARFDQLAIRYVLGVGQSDYIKERQKQRLKRKREDEEKQERKAELGLPPLQACGGDTVMRVEELPKAQTMERKRRTKEEMEEENRQLFASVVDLRAAGVYRRRCFDFAFTTDGVGARMQMRYATKKSSHAAPLTTLPSRGIWAIDQLKHLGRIEDVHVVGVDPGKRELVVGVDADDPKRAPVRYTQKERLRDLRSVQYVYEAKRGKPEAVKEAEASFAGYNSRSADLSTFCAYCSKRHEGLDACLVFYSDLGHRRRRWKTVIKTQRSEEKLYKRLEGIKKDGRRLILAYGSWGMVAGRPGAACNRGNAPCIGVGLMRKRFVVAPTPEAYTSKTCCRCLSACGPWAKVEEKMGKKIRGLRRCTQRDCMLPLNRDKNGAANIAANFLRLMRDEAPIRSMTDEDVAFHHASLCLECE